MLITAGVLLNRAGRRANKNIRGCTIRTAELLDVESIALIWAVSYADQGPDIPELPPSFLAERTFAGFLPRVEKYINRSDALVACDPGGAIIGFCVCLSDEIEQFWISAHARGTGVAAQLMQQSEALLVARGATRAHLYAFVRNARASRFYVRSGWDPVGARTHTVHGGHELKLMRFEKALSAPCARALEQFY